MFDELIKKMAREVEKLTHELHVVLPNEIRKAAIASGMRTLRQDGWLKVARGITSIEVVLRVTKAE